MASLYPDNPRLLSRPVGVWWAGWRTDTHRLQQSGWDLSVDFKIYDLSYRLAMRHQAMKLHAISDSQHLENVSAGMYKSPEDAPVFTVIHIAPSMTNVQMMGYDFSQFVPIDATPQITARKIERIEDMNIFATVGRAAHVMVDKADMSVIEHLEAIKALQSTKQQEIRRRELDATPAKREAPRLQIIASLAHYDEAA